MLLLTVHLAEEAGKLVPVSVMSNAEDTNSCRQRLTARKVECPVRLLIAH